MGIERRERKMSFSIRSEQPRSINAIAMPKKDFGGWFQIDTNLDENFEETPQPVVNRHELARKRVDEFHAQQLKTESSQDDKHNLKNKTANPPSFGLLVKAALIYCVSGHSI